MSDAVAVLTDIHANVAAPQAALGRIDELAIGRVYCGGALVGYGRTRTRCARYLGRTGQA